MTGTTTTTTTTSYNQLARNSTAVTPPCTSTCGLFAIFSHNAGEFRAVSAVASVSCCCCCCWCCGVGCIKYVIRFCGYRKTPPRRERMVQMVTTTTQTQPPVIATGVAKTGHQRKPTQPNTTTRTTKKTPWNSCRNECSRGTNSIWTARVFYVSFTSTFYM